MALSNNNTLAIPANKPGHVLLYDALTLRVLCVVGAHKSNLACLALTDDLLATASETGTLIRVFCVHSGEPKEVFRRGTTTAKITCMCFSPRIHGKQYLAAASDNGTIHLFHFDSAGDAVSATSNGYASSFMNALKSFPTSSAMASRGLLARTTFGLPLACAFYVPDVEVMAGTVAESARKATAPTLRAVTSAGKFYEFYLDYTSISSAELEFKRELNLMEITRVEQVVEEERAVSAPIFGEKDKND